MGIMRDIKEFFNPEAKRARLKAEEARLKAEEEARQKARQERLAKAERNLKDALDKKNEEIKKEAIETELERRGVIYAYTDGMDVYYSPYEVRSGISKYILETLAEVDIKNISDSYFSDSYKRETAKYYAKEEDVLKYIQELKKDPEEFNRRFLGFFSDCYSKDKNQYYQKVMQMFLENGADPTMMYDSDGHTILEASVWRGNPKIGKMMLEKGLFDATKQDAFAIFNLLANRPGAWKEEDVKEFGKALIRKGIGTKDIVEKDGQITVSLPVPGRLASRLGTGDYERKKTNDFVKELYEEIKKEPEIQARQRKEEQKRQNEVNRLKKERDLKRRDLAKTYSTMRQEGEKEMAQQFRKKVLAKKAGR